MFTIGNVDSVESRAGGAPALRRGMSIAAAIALALALLGMYATPALAERVHPFLFSTPTLEGPEPAPAGVAVNEATHHVYVVSDRGNYRGQIYNFTPAGELDSTQPTLTGAPDLAPYGLAVDNSGGAFAGYIYTSTYNQDLSVRAVQQFDPAGVATAVRIEASDLPADGTTQGGSLPPIVNNGFEPFLGLAVDGSGNILVYDRANNAIEKFTPAGTFVAQLGAGLVPFGGSIDIDSSGNIYVATILGVLELDVGGNCVNSCAPLFGPRNTPGVAIADDSKILTTDEQTGSIREYELSGDLVSESGSAELEHGFSIALDNTTGRVYVGDLVSNGGIAGTVDVFGPIFILPDATTEAATEVSDHGATFNGTVSADGGPEATCVFQYADDASFKAEGFKEASTVECNPAGPFSGEGDQAVEAKVEDLRGGATYHYRLLASSSNGPNEGEDKPFTTHGPGIDDVAAIEIEETAATLSGSVNPRGSDTSYRFQYVSQLQFGESGYANAVEVPLGGEGLGSGTKAVKVAQAITGLSPATSYRFRLLADSPEGSSSSADATFSTYSLAGAGLPDGRAYEQATPVRKNGSSVQGEPNDVQAARNGEGITFFATAGLPGGEGAQNFPTYLASRDSDGGGWSTQGFFPPAATGPLARILGWEEDLGQSYVSNRVVGSPGIFYVRSSADRSLQAIAEAEGPSEFNLAASSNEGQKVLLEGRGEAVAPGAAEGKANAYLWDRESGALTAVGILNDGNAPTGGAFPGPYDWFHSYSTGAGGARGSYYTQAAHSISADGTRAFFTAAGSGRIYIRENPSEAQSPLDLEGNCTDPDLACTTEISKSQRAIPDPNGEQPAAFLGATPDGTQVFFLSGGKLTDDAITGVQGSGRDLYRYDVVSGILTDLTPYAGAPNGAEVQGLLGMSDDGSHVYFAANGALAPGGEAGNCKIGVATGSCSIYLWHEGTISLVAQVDPGGSAEVSDQFNWAPTSSRPGTAGVEESAGRVTADGQTLLFRSTRQLSAYDNEGTSQLYRYRVGEGPPACVSCNPTGTSPTGSAYVQALGERFTGPKLPFAIRTRNLSADGDQVFFDTRDKLVAGDTNGVNDVYEWEAKGSGSCGSEEQNGGCLYLLSGGTGSEPSFFADADVSGDNVFFFTDESLVGQDKDELVDVYDARIGGGIAAQNQPPPPPPCEGEACKGGTLPSANFQSPGSASLVAPGNPKPNHKKKSKKKHGKKHHKKKTKHAKGGSGR